MPVTTDLRMLRKDRLSYRTINACKLLSEELGDPLPGAWTASWRSEVVLAQQRQQQPTNHHRMSAVIFTHNASLIHRVSKKLCKIVLSQVRQMSTKFDNFWHRGSTEDRFTWGALIFHPTYFASIHYRVKRRCSKLLHKFILSAISVPKSMKVGENLWQKQFCAVFLRHGVYTVYRAFIIIVCTMQCNA